MTGLEDLWEKLVAEPLGKCTVHKRHVLIVDALDECDTHTRRPLLEHMLRTCSSRSSPYLRILLTTRAQDDICGALEQESYRDSILYRHERNPCSSHSPDLVLKMTDPLDALPYEIWIWCMTFAVDGRKDGPLELLAVSRRWAGVLLDTPSLWNQIYIENGEDEMARIATFLRLSRGCSLHVDIMTALPNLDSVQLIVDHISRVSTISIRPSAADTVTALDMQLWEEAASRILGRLSNGPVAVKDSSCFGISLRENQELYYCVVLMRFTMENTVKGTNMQDSITCDGLPAITYPETWEERITRCAFSFIEELSLNIAKGTLAFPWTRTPTPESNRLIH
jgi:hypothetical protein